MKEIEADVLQSILQDHVGLIIFNETGDINYVSPKFKTVLGLPDLCNKGNYNDFLVANFVDELGNKLESHRHPVYAYFKSSQLINSTRLGVRIEGKGIQWGNLNCHEHYHEGKVTRFIVQFNETDFTKEHVIESCSFHIFHQIMDHFSGACFIQDLEGVVYYGNHRYFKETNLTKEAIIGKSYHSLYPDEWVSYFTAQDKMVLREDRAISFEDQMGDKVFLTTKFPIKILDRDDMVGGIAIDISELKHVEDNLRDSELELKDLNDTKDKLFSILAHDLRSPFCNIFSIVDLLYEEHELLEKADKEKLIIQLRNSSAAFLSLLDNLLNWTKTQSEGVKVNKRKVSMHELIENAVQLGRENARHKGIQIVNGVDANMELETDFDLTSAIIRNLVCNAIKFSPSGENICINAMRNGNKVVVDVKDNGVGMSEEMIQKLFDRNSHYSTHGTQGERGTGIGMLVCQQFMDLLEGKLEVDSKLNQGSTFKLTLPQDQSS